MQAPVNNRKFIARLLIASTFIMLPLYAMLALKWPRAHDFTFYGGLLAEFSRQFWQGDPYPRWLMHLYEGYGSSGFIYYYPLAFFALLPLEWMAPFDPYGLWRVCIGMQLALVLCGLTARRWLRHHFDEGRAQAGALVYAFFPYMPIIIYYNYGLSSLYAIAFFPLVLEAIDRLGQRGWRGVPRLALAFALVCLSHMLSLATFMVIPLTYSLAFAAPGARLRRSALVGVAGLLGVALSAVYLLPMQLNQPNIRLERFVEGPWHYAGHFWMLHSLFGFLCFIPPLAGLYLEQPRDTKPLVSTRIVVYWVLTIMLLLFMVLPISKRVWEIVKPLHYLQFPMRFYTGMWPAAAFLAALWLPQAKSRIIYPVLLCAMLANTAVNSWESWFSDRGPAPGQATLVTLNNNPEGLPRWVEAPLPEGIFEHGAQAALVEGEGTVQVERWSPSEIRFSATVKSDKARVVLHQFYFPRWQSAVGQPQPYHGLLSLPLDRGEHAVALSGVAVKGGALGFAVSGAALLLVGMLALAARRKAT